MQRRDSKPEIEVPRKASFGTDPRDRSTGWIVRLSVAGAEVESLQPPVVGADVVVWAELVPGEGELSLRGRVQWASVARFAVQFGPLGIKETSAIVRSTRRAA